ncbi:MAG TPA: hypothetical protein VFF90_01340 [Saprospiraceae bacterium]|nr:hypothetical protein [Saprospiraceae bacterium]
MELNRFQRIIRFKLTTSRWIVVLAVLGLYLSEIHISKAQNTFSDVAITNLHDGYLIVRFPTYTSKIDTLEAMLARTTDEKSKKKLNKIIHDTQAERDTFFNSYVRAFRSDYTFSKSAYIFDTDARNLNTASYYDMEGERISVGDLSESHLFYLYFERTEDSKIDAMVIYDRMQNKMRPPFPNEFAQGGLNLFFVKFSSKKFPAWRVGKMNKRLWKFYNEVKMNNQE